ncbi:50S ribosomal protein L11 methyltransferase [Cellulosilyticum sp. I15G10I2]|uniref:50S ribosomal protein L11 methyltransferase n=1 Tax=Cellulosilyticum sp. I15G10I2 TaxID=1892843 RepID=UPI00085CC794|nr:methyltransferase domain-containing protein [Cellulosilyticum sp. I15G10I2]
MDLFFHVMFTLLKIRDKVTPVDDRTKQFGINLDQTVVDYGCGVGSYSVALSKLVGKNRKVYELDIHPLAIQATRKSK